ncbi:MAG: radical SAM protein [Clostridia bacterium]|nr:radical SAM protein [Clostridia bacterium]
MKNIYLVQANAVYGDNVKNTYIPYAIGCLAAYAFSFPEIKNHYKLGKFIYTRLDIDKAMESIRDPYLVGFSASVWNSEYNKALSKAVKEKYPGCVIVFGGHQVPPDGNDAFTEYPHADIVIHSGGEEAFRDILLGLKNENGLSGIRNISVKHPDGTIENGERSNPSTPDYPSPYLEGIFDPIMNDGISFSAIIETNRGCPNHCAFCDWGILRSKVRLFDMEKVKAELKWLSDNKIEYVYCADANFGLFDRDMEITDEFIKLKKETGYPSRLKVNFTKNRCEFVGDISRKLSENDMGKSQTLSFQSVDPDVLSAIGRKNIDLEHFRTLLQMYARDNIPTYSELILGLPLETYESFTDGLCTLIENGQHKSINIYPCELLPNSRLGSKEYIEKYKIRTTKLPFRQFHCEKEDTGITEYSNLITETSSMTKKDWVDSYFFATLIQSFHCLDITRESAIYMRKVHGMPYKDFYTSLLGYVKGQNGSVLSEIFTHIKDHLSDVAEAKESIGFYDDRFGKISYEPDEHMFLCCVYEHEKVYEELRSFLGTLTDAGTADTLISYQKAILNLPDKEDSEVTFPVNFYSFFSSAEKGEDIPLIASEEKLILSSPVKTSSWEDYARFSVWYGRRNEGMHMKVLIKK